MTVLKGGTGIEYGQVEKERVQRPQGYHITSLCFSHQDTYQPSLVKHNTRLDCCTSWLMFSEQVPPRVRLIGHAGWHTIFITDKGRRKKKKTV